jgi:hypothetical protein
LVAAKRSKAALDDCLVVSDQMSSPSGCASHAAHIMMTGTAQKLVFARFPDGFFI